MSFSEKLLNSEYLCKKIQYSVHQLSERLESEVKYRTINCQFIIFDLRDKRLMLEVGRVLDVFGYKNHLINKFHNSKLPFLHIYAENALVERGRKFLRRLYLEKPNKFKNAEFESGKRTRMKLLKCDFVISEDNTIKSLSLHQQANQAFDMDAFQEKIKQSEGQFRLEQQFMQEGGNREQNLLDHAN